MPKLMVIPLSDYDEVEVKWKPKIGIGATILTSSFIYSMARTNFSYTLFGW